MPNLSLQIPESLYSRLKELASQEGISINQLVTTAVAEKVAALMTEEYLVPRGQRSSRSKYEAVLAKVLDRGPDAAEGV